MTPFQIDTNTPASGTPVTEWQRQIRNDSDGGTVHLLNNLLTGLVAIRYEAEYDGWTPALLANDRACEAHLLDVIRSRSH